jgi:hypothetical protein
LPACGRQGGSTRRGGWITIFLTGWNKALINSSQTLHPVSLLCKHSRNPPLNEIRLGRRGGFLEQRSLPLNISLKEIIAGAKKPPLLDIYNIITLQKERSW